MCLKRKILFIDFENYFPGFKYFNYSSPYHDVFYICSLLVVDIRPIDDFRACHMRGGIHFCYDSEQRGKLLLQSAYFPSTNSFAESNRHRAIRFYKEMQKLEKKVRQL